MNGFIVEEDGPETEEERRIKLGRMPSDAALFKALQENTQIAASGRFSGLKARSARVAEDTRKSKAADSSQLQGKKRKEKTGTSQGRRLLLWEALQLHTSKKKRQP